MRALTRWKAWLCLVALVLLATCCKREEESSRRIEPARPENPRPLVLSAIPDQNPELLQRLYGSLAGYLEATLKMPVQYKPVTDYKAAVTAFKVGDLDLVWFGGLTGVQARLQVPKARAILQRNVDERFRSVFIAKPSSGIKRLSDLKGHTFTFGSESSTSGRLMPQYFLEKAGVQPEDFRGPPGFSGSHDKTIALVAAGSYEAGVLSEQVWKQRVAEHSKDAAQVEVIDTTPTYRDYHWVLHPAVAERFGTDVEQKLIRAFTSLSKKDPKDAEILELFSADAFIPTNNSNYKEIEQVARKIGLVNSAP